jgi:hypothetical protein
MFSLSESGSYRHRRRAALAGGVGMAAGLPTGVSRCSVTVNGQLVHLGTGQTEVNEG